MWAFLRENWLWWAPPVVLMVVITLGVLIWMFSIRDNPIPYEVF